MSDPTLLEQLPVYITAVGALGIAAFGVVEAIGKTLFIKASEQGTVGLPFVGYKQKIKPLVKKVEAALKISYGNSFEDILLQQYRSGRGAGQAPETLRQGVRLGLPFMKQNDAVEMVKGLWGLDSDKSLAFVEALLAEKTEDSGPPRSEDEVRRAQGLAARFSTALDTRIQAAFDAAEEVYQAQARSWAGFAAVALSVGYTLSNGFFVLVAATETVPEHAVLSKDWPARLSMAILVGLVATPLAPTAKDLASSLSDALSALNKLPIKKR